MSGQGNRTRKGGGLRNLKRGRETFFEDKGERGKILLLSSCCCLNGFNQT